MGGKIRKEEQKMKIEVSKKDLLGAIKKVNSIGEAKNPPVLQSILLVPDPIMKALGIIHTTLGLTAFSKVEMKITDLPEEVLVEDKLFSQIIANQPEVVEMELQDKILRIGKYKISTLNVDDFPKIDNPGERLEEIKLDKDLSILKNFVSKDYNRYELRHIYFNKGTISATDGKTFVAYKVDNFDSQVLVKPEILNKAKTIEVYKNFVVVEGDNLRIRQAKVEGEFPEIEKYIPKYKDTVEFDLSELKDLVAKTIPLVTENSLAVKLIISKDKIEVSKKSERGEFKDEISAKSTIDLKIAFNPYYLLNFLRFIPEGKISTGVDNEHLILFQNTRMVGLLLPMKWEE